jgi:hypothetical protein
MEVEILLFAGVPAAVACLPAVTEVLLFLEFMLFFGVSAVGWDPPVVDIPSVPGVSTVFVFPSVVGVQTVLMLLLAFQLLLGPAFVDIPSVPVDSSFVGVPTAFSIHDVDGVSAVMMLLTSLREKTEKQWPVSCNFSYFSIKFGSLHSVLRIQIRDPVPF